MIIWDLNPVAFSIGPLEIRWYGIVYAAGFLLAYWLLRKAAREHTIKNLTVRHVDDYLLWLMLGSILCARLVHVITDAAYYYYHPSQIPAVWQGGLSFFGGLLGAALVTLWFTRRHKIRFYQMADLLVLPYALFLMFGRLANYANGELWGTRTDVAWCVQFPNVEGCRHPSQLYEALYSYVLFFTLLLLQETRKLREGVLFWSFVLLYGIFRFFENFFRELEPTDPGILGLSTGQWFCLVMVLVAAFWFVQHRRVTNKA
jgi:phosphatidylglycerol:prolipoprotein diacylglycerol transferase